MTATIGLLLRSVTATVGSAVEARRIVAHAAGLDDSSLLARIDDEVTADVENAALVLVQRVHDGEPLQYVLGHWGFRQSP